MTTHRNDVGVGSDLGVESGPGQEPLDVLRERLGRLRRFAGEPSLQEISRRTKDTQRDQGPISHPTVATVLRCAKTPSWGRLEVVVEALAGDVEEFRLLWVAARDADDERTDPPANTASPTPPGVPSPVPGRPWFPPASPPP